jgi:ADP-ribosylglycohydrolase
MSADLANRLIAEKSLPAPPWFFTDDTLMAISVVATLEEHGGIDQDFLANSFASNYDSSRGYGAAMHGLLSRVRQTGDWQKEAQALFHGEGSFGNGAAMRVAPLGAYFADDLHEVVEHATLSAVTTHSHVEGIAGAIAVAVASALASRYAEASQLPAPEEMLMEIHKWTPESAVRQGIWGASQIPSDTPARAAAYILGNGSAVTAQDTVPFAAWNAACHLHSYEHALWSTVSGLGDRDTTCAIVGGIVVMSAGTGCIPPAWLSGCEPIPNHLLKSPQLLTLE